MTLDQLGARDEWRCWVCGGCVDRTVAATAPTAPTVDHVLPRSQGGGNEPANLRLAHRRCNGRRGSRVPELHWPADLPVDAPAPLLPVVRRALRRPGEWEVVALAATPDLAARAVAWLRGALSLVLGPGWEVRADEPVAGPARVLLRAAADGAAGAGAPRTVRKRP